LTDIQIKSRPTENHPPLPGLSRVMSQVLRARNINNVAGIDYGLKNLLPPQGLTNISESAELLVEAISADASIVIVGDFDADGATSCALAVKCLKAFGLNDVSYLVPNRFEYGYGLSPEIVGVAAMRQPDVIITVDNGISSIDGVHAAQALGISVLITDHHLPGDEIPTADVIVNPNLPNDRFASKNLAGVGVIFYVMLAVRARLREVGWFAQSGIVEPNMSQFLDLVALGTVADVVPLDQNNRILVQQGMQRIRQGNACPGIQALLTVGNRNAMRLSSSDLGFAVGPRDKLKNQCNKMLWRLWNKLVLMMSQSLRCIYCLIKHGIKVLLALLLLELKSVHNAQSLRWRQGIVKTNGKALLAVLKVCIFVIYLHA